MQVGVLNEISLRWLSSRLVGISGGVGAGKSTVAKLFAEYMDEPHGAAVVNSGMIALRTMLDPQTAVLVELQMKTVCLNMGYRLMEVWREEEKE